jgi:hypothetical protein
MFNIGDLIWYNNWADNEYIVEITEVYKNRVRCTHTNPQHKDKGFVWYFGEHELIGNVAENLYSWLDKGKARHYPSKISWEV